MLDEIPPHKLEFLRIHQARLCKAWSWPEHRNLDIELTYVIRGAFHGFADQMEYRAGEGDIYFVQPGQVHWEEAASDQLDYICLRFKLWNEAGESVGFLDNRPERTPCVRGKNNKIDHLMEQILKLFWFNNDPEQVFAPLIFGIMRQIRIQYETPQAAAAQSGRLAACRDKIAPALHLMQANPNRAYSVDDLAGACYISSNHFSHVFKKALGVSPLRYLNLLRIEKSKRLLTGHQLKIHQIATALGFDDQFYFSRLFKKVTGLSPQEYRENTRQSPP